MVRSTEKRSLRPASCCSVLVMNGAYGRRRYGFSSTRVTAKSALVEAGGQAAGAGLVEVHHVAAGPAGLRVEVTAGGDAVVVQRDQRGGERRRVAVGRRLAEREESLDVPVVRRAEAHPGPLALDHQPGGHGLHAARRQPRHDLLPQHRADLVAVQPVEDAPGLLRIDQVGVDVPRVLHRAPDRLGRDLVEDHPPDRHPRLERLDQVPGDRLALAVLIRGEVELGRRP